MRHNLNIALEFVLEKEGLYSDDPKDPGGQTVMGISRLANPDWEGWKKIDEILPATFSTLEDILPGLILEDVKEFYTQKYWHKIKADNLPSGIDIFMFDYAVNQGVYRAITALQFASGAKEDGVLGPKTDAGLEVTASESLLERVIARRIADYIRVGNDDARERYAQGWANRLVSAIYLAQEEFYDR